MKVNRSKCIHAPCNAQFVYIAKQNLPGRRSGSPVVGIEICVVTCERFAVSVPHYQMSTSIRVREVRPAAPHTAERYEK